MAVVLQRCKVEQEKKEQQARTRKAFRELSLASKHAAKASELHTRGPSSGAAQAGSAGGNAGNGSTSHAGRAGGSAAAGANGIGATNRGHGQVSGERSRLTSGGQQSGAEADAGSLDGAPLRYRQSADPSSEQAAAASETPSDTTSRESE